MPYENLQNDVEDRDTLTHRPDSFGNPEQTEPGSEKQPVGEGGYPIRAGRAQGTSGKPRK